MNALLSAPLAKLTPAPEYPRNGCPECKGEVELVIVTCSLDEEHERYECQDCGEDDLTEEDLIIVNEEGEVEETLDAAAVLRAGRVMSSLVPWVKARIAS